MANTNTTTVDDIAFAEFVKNIADGKPEARLALAQRLKDKGFWTGALSSDMTTKYYNALVKMEEAYKSQAAVDKVIGKTPAKRWDFLATYVPDDTTDTGGPKTTVTRYITSETQTSKILDSISKELLGRNLTDAERKKYTKLLNTAQQQQPSTTTSGSGYSTTKGGVDEEQFITEQLRNTNEAKTKRATDAYALMMQELGGLR